MSSEIERLLDEARSSGVLRHGSLCVMRDGAVLLGRTAFADQIRKLREVLRAVLNTRRLERDGAHGRGRHFVGEARAVLDGRALL